LFLQKKYGENFDWREFNLPEYQAYLQVKDLEIKED